MYIQHACRCYLCPKPFICFYYIWHSYLGRNVFFQQGLYPLFATCSVKSQLSLIQLALVRYLQQNNIVLYPSQIIIYFDSFRYINFTIHLDMHNMQIYRRKYYNKENIELHTGLVTGPARKWAGPRPVQLLRTTHGLADYHHSWPSIVRTPSRINSKWEKNPIYLPELQVKFTFPP